MSRTADHVARHRQLSEAVLAVALSGGLPRVTVAKVAADAGVSVGLVQHYFPSKEALLREAYQEAFAAVLARVDRAVAESERAHARIEHMLAESLAQLLPLDAQRRKEHYLMSSFAALALDHPRLREVLSSVRAQMRSRIGAAIDNGRKCGEVPPTVDTAAATAIVSARVVGWADSLALSPEDAAIAHDDLADLCRSIFSGVCDRE